MKAVDSCCRVQHAGEDLKIQPILKGLHALYHMNIHPLVEGRATVNQFPLLSVLLCHPLEQGHQLCFLQPKIDKYINTYPNLFILSITHAD